MQKDMIHFTVLGGDQRQRWLAMGLMEDGYPTSTCAVPEMPEQPLPEALQQADVLILPLPAFAPDGTLTSQGGTQITAAEILAGLRPTAKIFGGKLQGAAGMFHNGGFAPVDYMALETVAAANAVPTAEGAIQIALARMKITLQDSCCLVIGWGRIGKILARKLQLLGAKVTVSVRRPADAAMVRALGMCSDTTGVYGGGLDYDLVLNTVPAPVLDQAALMRTRPDVLILDLASAPGGVDFAAAQRLGRTALPALGLPGKTAPKTAGRIIKDAVLAYLQTC